MPVYFHLEDCTFKLHDKKIFKNWIQKVIEKENARLGTLNIIFTSNSFLLKINQKYLNHSYFTDVITFNDNNESIISGDIFVSIDQVKLNSKDLDIDFKDELSRVIIHGVLHLLGYNDKTDLEKQEMRKVEDLSIKILKEDSDGQKV